MRKQLNTMLIISHKHYINTNCRDSMVLLRLLYDIREALCFKNITLSAFSGFSRVRCWNPAVKSGWGWIWPDMQIWRDFNRGRIRHPVQLWKSRNVKRSNNIKQTLSLWNKQRVADISPMWKTHNGAAAAANHRAGSMATAVGNRSFSNRWERICRWSIISTGSVRMDTGT